MRLQLWKDISWCLLCATTGILKERTSIIYSSRFASPQFIRDEKSTFRRGTERQQLSQGHAKPIFAVIIASPTNQTQSKTFGLPGHHCAASPPITGKKATLFLKHWQDGEGWWDAVSELLSKKRQQAPSLQTHSKPSGSECRSLGWCVYILLSLLVVLWSKRWILKTIITFSVKACKGLQTHQATSCLGLSSTSRPLKGTFWSLEKLVISFNFVIKVTWILKL